MSFSRWPQLFAGIDAAMWLKGGLNSMAAAKNAHLLAHQPERVCPSSYLFAS